MRCTAGGEEWRLNWGGLVAGCSALGRRQPWVVGVETAAEGSWDLAGVRPGGRLRVGDRGAWGWLVGWLNGPGGGLVRTGLE